MNPSNTPGDSSISIRVSSIQFVFIIQIDCSLKGFFGRFAPFENLLCPVHPHIAVHFPSSEEFYLAGVPEGIVCPPCFQFFQCKDMTSLIMPVRVKGFLCPFRKAIKTIIKRIIIAEIIGELFTHKELIEKYSF